MGQTKTNNFSMSYAVESAVPGVLSGSPAWKQIEPNAIPDFGAEITTVSRQPISKRRQRRKGKTTDLSSGLEVEMDFCMDPFEDMIGFFAVADWQNSAPQKVTACDTNSFTTADANITYATGTLVAVRGMAITGNNGLHVVNGTPSDIDTPVTTVLIAETSPPANAIIERAGIRGAAGDLRIDVDGNLVSTSLNFTTLQLQVGQTIWIGGSATVNQFFQQASTLTNYGYARVLTIAANKLTLDKKSTVFVTDDGTSTGSGGTARAIDLFFGRFLRNVPSDDAIYQESSLQFEGAYPNLDSDGDTMYEYSTGNFANEATFELPETNKATMKFNFVGIDTELPTQTRKTNASTALEPVRTDSMSTSTDIARLRLVDTDDEGMSTCFKKLTLSLKNNVEPEKCLGTLGSPYINLGNFEVNIETTVMFTNANVVAAIKNNTTMSFDFALDNDDGAVFFDIPALTLGGGKKDFPINKSITMSLTGEAFGDSVFDASLMVSTFPHIPSV